MQVLIADDDSISNKLMRVALERAGHEVLAFDEGAELVAAFEAAPRPLVVTDWLMPRMSGLEVCERIRSIPGTPYAHIIVVTTLSSAEHTLEAYRAGADDFVAKPFDPTVFLARVAAVERSAQRQEEIALRDALESCQSTLSHDHVALGALLGRLAVNARRQRAFARCRAFLRRQLVSAVKSGASREETRRIRDELNELENMEEEAVGVR